MGTTLFSNAAQIVTNSPAGEGELGVVTGGDMLVDADGFIAWVGQGGHVPEQPQVDHEVDLGGRVVVPGFVECHTHLVFAGDRTQDYAERCAGRSYEEVAKRGGGIRLSVRETRRASHQELLALGKARLREFLEMGVTTVEIKTGYGLSFADELKCLEVISELAADGPAHIVPTLLGAHIVPDEYADNRDAYIRMLTDELVPEVARRGLASFVDVFCETGAYSIAEARRIFESAEKHGLGIKVHAEQLSRTGAARLASEFGAISADHLEYIENSDIEAMKASGTVAVLLPGAGLFLGGEKRPPARALLDAGVTVALSTDFNPGTCPSVHLPLMTTLGCSWLGMSPHESLRSVTSSAAKALDLRDGRGTLAVGAPADFSVHSINSWMEIPYLFGRNTVDEVWVAGNREH